MAALKFDKSYLCVAAVLVFKMRTKGTKKTMPKGRPGGNPDLEKYQFQQKYDWDEPCSDRMQLRMPPSMKKAIKAGLIKDWQEVARRAIAQRLGRAESASEIEKSTEI